MSNFKKTNYSGWLVENRSHVLTMLAAHGFESLYERVILEHITYQYPDTNVAPAIKTARIIGHVAANGVQAVVVAIDGSTTRPDGKVYHITYSIDQGHKPVESNDLIKNYVMDAIVPAIELKVSAF